MLRSIWWQTGYEGRDMIFDVSW